MRRACLVLFVAAALMLTVVSAAPPAASQTPCDVAFAEAGELDAFLSNNTTDSAHRRVKLEADLRRWIVDVQTVCGPMTGSEN